MDKYQTQYENECYTLGCFIKEPSLLNETKLKENHYFNYNNKSIFTKLIQLKENGESIDLIGLQQSNSEDLFKMGGTEHLREVYDSAISVHSFKHYENLVAQFMSVHLALEMINVFHTETKEVHRVSELRNLIDKLQQVDIDTGTKEKSTYEKIKSRVEQHLNSPKVGLSGVHAGFLNINKATDGWQPTDLIILAARPSMGGFAPLVSNNKLKIA